MTHCTSRSSQWRLFQGLNPPKPWSLLVRGVLASLCKFVVHYTHLHNYSGLNSITGYEVKHEPPSVHALFHCSRRFSSWVLMCTLSFVFSVPQACIRWTSRSTRAFEAPLRDWPWMTRVSQCRETVVWPWEQAGGEDDCFTLEWKMALRARREEGVITYDVTANENKSLDSDH